MRWTWILFIAMAWSPSPATAVGGVDVTINACPVDGGVGLDAGTLDCSDYEDIRLLVTFAPSQAIPDLVSISGTILLRVAGDLDTNNFWDVAGCGLHGFSVQSSRPSIGCSAPLAYLSLWNAVGSGSAVSVIRLDANTLRINYTAHRPSSIAVAAGQRCFGVQITIDKSNAWQSSGNCLGCSAPVCIRAASLTPHSNSGLPTTTLVAGTGSFPGFGNTMSFNGAS